MTEIVVATAYGGPEALQLTGVDVGSPGPGEVLLEVRAAGVNPVRALAPEGIDAAIDNIGTDEAIDVSLELVTDRSRIATIAAPARGFEAGIKVLGGAPGADAGVEVRMAARLELVSTGKLEVLVDRTFPLASAAAAHRYVGAGHTHGKVVLVTG